MTPSYTTSTDNTNTIQTYEQKPLQVFSPKSPKEEEEEVIDDTKLSKKASLLKKKIVQRKNKNSILKLELNDLIENLQLLKKQYDMISNAFGSGIKPTNCELPSIPDSTLDITDVNLTVEDSTSYNRNNNDNDNNNKPALTIKNEISGYYFKRTGTMLYADDEESGLIDGNAFTAKKRKTIPTSISNQQDDSNNNIFMSNINLITDNILNTMPTTVPLKNNNTSDVALNLMTIQDVLQQPDIQPMNSVMGFNENNTYNNLLFNERNNSTSNFDFFLENNENINLDDDVNMDFLNF
ncbi:hypothetical protein HANVADRAFT_101604 [Hanseniaspora valbyensis NRRL Y-1626]|uniref:Uncharacterized protein n=1 Tax=Hanseniaspora valbyensis NRRL Y-1626 TaxID=766949 RepID=A0A1B7T7W2_9ASCO|nr:hypothetical protein HANVADRAFT_101604 [Hanseniaspora valbyensis NRRL Y-1626]